MTRADDEDAGSAGIEEWRHDGAADDEDAGSAGIEEWRHDGAADDEERSNAAGAPPACGGEWRI